jgi:hypothetical protein
MYIFSKFNIATICNQGIKKIPVVPLPDQPNFFLPTLLFFQRVDRATLFSPGGCGLLIQRAKMASIVTLVIMYVNNLLLLLLH